VKRAVALRYGDADEAPVVVSSGEGDLALRIERSARDYGVPVVLDVPLAEALFEAVAAVLRELADGA